MDEVLIGAALPLVVCVAIYLRQRARAGWKLLVFGPVAMLVSGIVGVIPDLPRLFGDFPTYYRWHHARWCNLAWGHCWIDARNAIDEWAWWPAVVIGAAAMVIGAAYRELVLAERGR